MAALAALFTVIGLDAAGNGSFGLGIPNTPAALRRDLYAQGIADVGGALVLRVASAGIGTVLWTSQLANGAAVGHCASFHNPSKVACSTWRCVRPHSSTDHIRLLPVAYCSVPVLSSQWVSPCD